MATEEEAREAADGEEVHVEAADLETAHLQMNLDRKLSSHEEITDQAKIMDSAEGLLKVREDQVSEKAPSAVEIPPDRTPNGSSSSLNGHIKEENISNDKPQENGQKDSEHVEASPDGISTNQSNRSNGEEAVHSLGHVESTTEDTGLLEHENEEPKEHYQQDAEGAAVEDKLVHEDTLQTNEPAVDAQQCQNLKPVEVTEDTHQHASMSCIPHDEVVAEAPVGVQTSLEPNVNDSEVLPDATDGNAETEPTKVDKESCPEDENVAEHPNENFELEDQPSKKTDGVDADLVKEEVPKSKKTDVPEDMTKTEQADESTNGDQEELNQESSEDTSGPVHGKAEETSHESNVSASEKTTPEHDATSREPALDVQEEQNQGSAEEISDAKEVDTEETAQQSGFSFEEAAPEDNVATIEPTSDIQHVNNVELEETKGLEDAKAEEPSNQSNAKISEDAAQDREATEDIQPVQGLEEEELGSTRTVEMAEASNQPHANVLNNLAEEDGVPACQPQVIELKEDVNDTGVTETQEIIQQSHVAASEELISEDNSMAVESQKDDIQHSLEQESVEVKDKEAPTTQEICHERTISACRDSVEDDVAAEEPTCDVQEAENVESVEETRDNIPDNIVEASNVATVEESDQENSVPADTEEASDQSNPALLNDPPQEDSIPSDMTKTDSATEVAESEATRTEAFPQESDVSTFEEPASEENITASEISCDAQEVENSEQAEEVEFRNKDTETKEISGKSNEMATKDNTTILTDSSIQQPQEQEPIELRDSEATEPQGIPTSHIASTPEESTPEDNVTAEPSPDTQAENSESATVTEETKNVETTDGIAEEETPEHTQEVEAPVHTPPVEEPELEETKNTDDQMNAAVLENPTHEDNPTASESLVMESEVSSSEATEGQEMPRSEATQSEDNETKENTAESELEPAEEISDSEAIEPRSISQQSIASSQEESVSEDVTTKEPASDIKEVQTEEPELIEEHNDVKAGEISNKSGGTIVGETAQENLESATVAKETTDVESPDAIADEETPEEQVHESEAPADIPPVEEPELEQIKNTEPVEVHDNVTTDEEVKDTEAIESAEIHNESGDLPEDVKSNVALADEVAPDEDAKATEATADIPQAQELEVEEIKNSEPAEVRDNVTTDDQPAEEVKATEAIEIAEIHNESGDLTEDVRSNVALADEAAPGEDGKATEAAADMPQAHDQKQEETKNSEPVEVEDDKIASDLPEEEIKDTEVMETEMIPDESTSANISELTNDVKSNVAPVDEAAPEEHVIVAEATTDIPRAQEPELEEIKNTEPKVEENISATDQSAEDITATKVMETEAINESTDAKNIKLTEDVNRNFDLEDEAAHEEHVIAAETTVDIPRAQEPELEEINNTEPIVVKEDVSASDLPAEEVKETEVIPESTDADISEPTEDANRNVALADEAAPEEHVIATEATVDIPRAQEQLEEIENAEHVQVEENISANRLPAEEVKDTETVETEAVTDNTDSITEQTEDPALPDEAVPDVSVDILPAHEPAVEEINNTEPVEAEDSITADDVPAEEINDTEVMETEQTPHQSTDDSLTASAPLADIQQIPEQEAVEDKKCTDSIENQGKPQQSIVSTAAELTPTEENTPVAESAQESPLLGADLASDLQKVFERDSAEETRGTEAVQTEDDQQHGVSNLEKPVSENNVPESEAHVAMQEKKLEEVEDTEAMGTEEISIQVPTTENEAQESSEPGSDPDFLVHSEDSKDQFVKAEETGQSNGASLEEQTAEAEDNAANETGLLADTKEDHGVESVEGHKGIDATEGEEVSYESQDARFEELVSESVVATIEPTSEIQQVNDLDEAKEMTATEAIDEEETSCKKTEVATSEDPSPADNATTPKQMDESDLGEETAFTTQERESPTVEDVTQISDEDTVGISNNTDTIEEQSKEQDAIQSGDHTNDQDIEQLQDVELPMQVCDRSLDVSAIEQPDEDVQKVNLDQQQNEDEAIEKQTEEIQRDEQKHDDSNTDLTTEILLEPQSSEIGTTNLHEDVDVFEAEQAETVVTEVLMNEQTQHIPQGSIPSIADVDAEKSTETEEMPEQENAPNKTEILYTDAEDAKENIAKPSTDGHDGTIDETINEETPTFVPQNVEPKVHDEEEGCINNVNDDMHAIQASEQEIVDEVEKKKEMKNQDTNVNNDAIQTKPVDKEASVLHSSDSTDSKVDDTMSHYAEMVDGKIDPQPTEIEEVEQDLSIHPKVEDENLTTAEQNGAEVETSLNEEMATSSKAVTEAVKLDEATDDKASGAEEALSDENLDTFENNRRNLEASSVLTASGESMNEDKEHHNLALPAHSGVNGDTTEQASVLEVTERGLLFPEKPLPTESEEQEESQTTKQQDEEDVHDQETGEPEEQEKEAEQSDLPVSNFLMNLIMGKESTEPEGNPEFEAEKKQEETTNDESCLITSQQEKSFVPIPADLKVDNKLIFEQGKHNLEGSEETHDSKVESDDELSRNTHDLEAPVCQNNVQAEISSELVPGGPGTMREEETGDVKLDEKATNYVCQEHTEVGTQIEEGSLNRNLDDSTNSKASQDDTLEEDLQHESLPEDRSFDAEARQTLLQTEPDMGAEKKLPDDIDDLQSPLSTKREESTESSITEAESTIEAELENEVKKEEDKQHTTNTGKATEGQKEKSHDNSQKGIEAISDEQTDEITEPVMGNEINLAREKDISSGSECQDEKQSYKLTNSELDNSEKALEIQSDGTSLHINQNKQDEFSREKILMEENNLLVKPGESTLQEGQDTEIGQESPRESHGGDQNCLAIREPVIKEENVNTTVESYVQTVNTKSNEEQETFKSQVQARDLDVVSAKEDPKTEENGVEMAKPEFSTDEEQTPKKDKSDIAGEKTYVDKTKDEDEAKSFTGEATKKNEEQGAVQKVSQRDLSVVLPTEAPGSEGRLVDIKKAEFSTDEEHSPNKDESNMVEDTSYDEKTNGAEEAKNVTDEGPMKTEEREAGQKASPKKHNILSGVGSKVKHQLAKVKKAIIGKPGHTKSELAKS